MNGQLMSPNPGAAFSASVQLVTFCESSRAAICHTLHIRTANIASIRALAADGVNSGEPLEALQQIELIAAELVQQVSSLTMAIAQLQAAEPLQKTA